MLCEGPTDDIDSSVSAAEKKVKVNKSVYITSRIYDYADSMQ